MSLNDEDAHNLHMNYYKTYGLAIEGLVRNHQVDALDYNSKVDDALDLHSVLRYDSDLRKTLIAIKNHPSLITFGSSQMPTRTMH